jgi:hypothetical protein
MARTCMSASALWAEDAPGYVCVAPRGPIASCRAVSPLHLQTYCRLSQWLALGASNLYDPEEHVFFGCL